MVQEYKQVATYNYFLSVCMAIKAFSDKYKLLSDNSELLFFASFRVFEHSYLSLAVYKTTRCHADLGNSPSVS